MTFLPNLSAMNPNIGENISGIAKKVAFPIMVDDFLGIQYLCNKKSCDIVSKL